MANAGARFASELHRRLVSVLGDDAPSEAHVSRLVRTPPERLNLTTSLRCAPSSRAAQPTCFITETRLALALRFRGSRGNLKHGGPAS